MSDTQPGNGASGASSTGPTPGYFVVVDDVWEVNTWERINLALVENNCGSRVITTTRKFDVAQKVGEVYKLQPLSYENSKKLFYTRIFGMDEKYLDNQPDDVSDKILKKCGGIPLAIITMTSLLVEKPKDQWSEVYNSIGFGHKDNRDAEHTMMILSFSYYDMPSHLRTCLLYLSTYPEDYLIKKNPLIRKWIAEGFVHAEQGTRLFELGEGYFNDLVNRRLIQEVEMEFDGEVYGCRVHDMVLDLMRKFSFEENFFSLLDDNVEWASSSSNVRRLSHQNRAAEHIIPEANVIEMPKVRSYAAFRCYINNRVQFLRFKLLRVLDIEDCGFMEGCHLEHVGNLLHLRYLGIRQCGYHPELPKQIGDLKLLQTLDVSRSSTLPASIIQLTQLMRLCAGFQFGIGKLTSLEDLEMQGHMLESFAKELGSLRELRVLNLSPTNTMNKSMQRDFVESLHNLEKIQHIKVSCYYSNADTAMWEAAGFVLPRPLRHLDMIIYFSKLPSCINPSRLPNLSYLRIFVTSMDEQDLKLLARLPALCFLDLSTASTVIVSEISASDCFFQRLKFLTINQTVQFWQPNEEDSSVSLHTWSGGCPMSFGCRKSDCGKLVPASAVMPNLEDLYFDVWISQNNKGDCGSFGWEYLPSLRQVGGSVNCLGVSAVEGDAVLAALRNECDVHPNHPTLKWTSIPILRKKKEKKQQGEAGEATSLTADVDVGN